MGKPTGFLEFERKSSPFIPVTERVRNYDEFFVPLADEVLARQGGRCMDCGIPYCHQGCPVNNIIPDWNDLVFRGDWREALEVLHSTNNFPEFTGRICPAPCESACTLNIIEEPVTIKDIERAIIDKGWAEGWVSPQPPAHMTGKKVAIVGSGPAGMACAQQLARVGHEVTVFEKADRIGGLLRYGIPDFKMEKTYIDSRIEQMESEGVVFRPNSHVGVNVAPGKLVSEFDAVVLAGGAEEPRDLPISGHELDGIHFAMTFLNQQNRRVAGEVVSDEVSITAKDKHVVVIGGGDTGSDCIGTSNRQGARSITQLEILPQPPEHENKGLTWPEWPLKLRTSSSQEEGCKRDWSVMTKSFGEKDGRVDSLKSVRVAWVKGEDNRMEIKEVAGSDFDIRCDLVLLAMGFVHSVHEGMVKKLGVELDEGGNVKANTTDYCTSLEKVFSAGDMRRGQSLVVWAIREGRQCACAVDEFLMGETNLPR